MELQAITDALNDEEKARLELMKEQPDFDLVKKYLNLASTFFIKRLLNFLNSDVKTGTISHRTYNKLKRALNSVSKLDNGVSLSPSTEKEKEKNIKNLSTAYDIKVRIVKQIVSLEPVLKSNP